MSTALMTPEINIWLEYFGGNFLAPFSTIAAGGCSLPAAALNAGYG